MQEIKAENVKAIIGLGNPGRQYYHNRHNIGFRIVDALSEKYMTLWRSKENMEITDIMIGDQKIILIKPQTFMNASGTVISHLIKQGIKAENILVVHDELELPFGQIKFKVGGSHRGHNGLKSIISVCGPDFARLRFGIGRPEQKEEVPNYVLRNFVEDSAEVDRLRDEAVEMLEQLFT